MAGLKVETQLLNGVRYHGQGCFLWGCGRNNHRALTLTIAQDKSELRVIVNDFYNPESVLRRNVAHKANGVLVFDEHD
jgi:hypothetical protein